MDNIKFPLSVSSTEFTVTPPGQDVFEIVQQIAQLHGQMLQIERQMLDLLVPIVKMQAQPLDEILQPAPWKGAVQDKPCDPNDF